MLVDNSDRFGNDEAHGNEKWTTPVASTDQFSVGLDLAGFGPGVAALMEYRPSGAVDSARQIFAGRAQTCIPDAKVIDWDKRRRRGGNGGR